MWDKGGAKDHDKCFGSSRRRLESSTEMKKAMGGEVCGRTAGVQSWTCWVINTQYLNKVSWLDEVIRKVSRQKRGSRSLPRDPPARSLERRWRINEREWEDAPGSRRKTRNLWSPRAKWTVFPGRGSDQLGQMLLTGEVRSRLRTVCWLYWRTPGTLTGAAFDSWPHGIPQFDYCHLGLPYC